MNKNTLTSAVLAFAVLSCPVFAQSDAPGLQTAGAAAEQNTQSVEKLKDDQAYQSKVRALMAETTAALKAAKEQNERAHNLDSDISRRIRETLAAPGDHLAVANFYLPEKHNLQIADGSLLVAIGTLETAQDLIPMAKFDAEQLKRVRADVREARAFVSGAKNMISSVEEELP